MKKNGAAAALSIPPHSTTAKRHHPSDQHSHSPNLSSHHCRRLTSHSPPSLSFTSQHATAERTPPHHHATSVCTKLTKEGLVYRKQKKMSSLVDNSNLQMHEEGGECSDELEYGPTAKLVYEKLDSLLGAYQAEHNISNVLTDIPPMPTLNLKSLPATPPDAAPCKILTSQLEPITPAKTKFSGTNSSTDEALIYEKENSPLVMDGLQLHGNQCEETYLTNIPTSQTPAKTNKAEHRGECSSTDELDFGPIAKSVYEKLDSLLGAYQAKYNLSNVPTDGSSIPPGPTLTLNSLPTTLLDAAPCKIPTSRLEPIMPAKTNKAEHRQEYSGTDSSTDEAVIYEQENSPLVMDGLQLQENQPDTEKTDLSKNPQQKPRREKHRPEVIIEATKNTPKSSTERPSVPQNNTGVKRKYAQRKGVESNPTEERSDETDLDKNVAPDSVDSPVGKRKYVKRKGVSKPEEENMDMGAPEKTEGKNRPALSSSTFMAMAARFPVRSKIHHVESDEEKLCANKEPEVCLLDPDFGLNKEMFNQTVCRGDVKMLDYPEDDSTKEVKSVKPFGSSSVELIENDNFHGGDTQDTFSSRNSADSPVVQTAEKTDSCLPNTSEEEPKADIKPDRVTSSNSFAKLLQMVDTVLHGVYEK